MIEVELFDGTILEFPAGTADDVIDRVARQETQARQQARNPAPGSIAADAAGNPVMSMPPRADAPPAPAPARPPVGVGADIAASLPDGFREGISLLLGAPVDLVSNAPRLLNVLPGVDGVGPISASPFGGRESIDAGIRTASGLAAAPVMAGVDAVAGTDLLSALATNSMGLPAVPDYAPQTGPGRIANRVGQELGATAVPVAAAGARAAGQTISAVNAQATMPRTMGQAIESTFVQPMALAPATTMGREAALATGAGLGAGLATETFGEGPLTDLGGSVAGAAATGTIMGLGGAVQNALAALFSSPNMMDDTARLSVAERIINSSAQMQAQAAGLAARGAPLTSLDTTGLAAQARTQAPIEEAAPGFRANLADRTQDPGLATMAFNADGRAPGAAAVRRTNNETAINDRMTSLAPEGDPARFRAQLQTGVDNRIAAAENAVDGARTAFENIVDALQPFLREAGARGSQIRAALSDAFQNARQQVDEAYRPINEAQAEVDIGPLAEAFRQTDAGLPLNDQTRFRPSEADTPGRLIPEGQETATVPLREVTSIRSGLTDDARIARGEGRNQAARVAEQYVGAIENFLPEALPQDLLDQLRTAQATRRDVADRFERPGGGLERILRSREGGGFEMPDNAVPGVLAQPDQGRVQDFRAALREAGDDPRLRDSLADEIRSDVQTRGLLNRPEALGKYMADRQVLLGEFPELRRQLEDAGVSRETLTMAERVAQETTRDLTTAGRSPEATFLAANVDNPAEGLMRAALSRPDRAEAVRELIQGANSPTAVQDLRAALWQEVRRTGRMQADGMTGEARWNGKKLRALFDDPNFAPVARELWADDPQELADIERVFSVLANADTTPRARAAGTSGSGQILAGGFDPALTGASVASRARSVSRNQLSPVIAGVDLLGTYLRRRTAQMQGAAIDQLTAEVINNPGLAADLLERYNPATAGAYRARLVEKYGVRIPTVLSALEESEEGSDPLLDAIGGPQ
jgi:hypothetical protein